MMIKLPPHTIGSKNDQFVNLKFRVFFQYGVGRFYHQSIWVVFSAKNDILFCYGNVSGNSKFNYTAAKVLKCILMLLQ